MVASPDHLLDPRFGYEPEQHDEWLKEETEMPKYGKRDANHNEIRDAARAMGATVLDTPGAGQTCPGFPDMVWFVRKVLTSYAGFRREVTEVWFVEVKAGPKEELNDNEEAMRGLIEAAGGQYIIVRSVDDVERLLKR